jgi:hypothetical protein
MSEHIGTLVQFRTNEDLYKAYKLMKSIGYKVVIDPTTKVLLVKDEYRDCFIVKMLNLEKISVVASKINKGDQT